MNIFLHSLHHFLMKIRDPRFSPGTVKQQKLRKIKAQLTVGFQEVNLKAEKHDGLNTSLIGNEQGLEGPNFRKWDIRISNKAPFSYQRC